MGFRYRVHIPVPGLIKRSIDIAFPGRKLAINIDGCFWHGCQLHRTLPRTNHDWWREKIEQNRRRDRETDTHLWKLGWIVLRFWEHEKAEDAVTEIIRNLQ
jgi:DNA mismatch endonuclease (patch repair protein)